jgi:hypothetical protein
MVNACTEKHYEWVDWCEDWRPVYPPVCWNGTPKLGTDGLVDVVWELLSEGAAVAEWGSCSGPY